MTAADMRERCAQEAESWDDASVSGGRARCVANAIRALPIPAPTSPPPCSCSDRIAAGTPRIGPDGAWGMDVEVSRAHAEAHGYSTDWPVWLPVRGCPWCARPLPDAAMGKP